MKISPLKFYVDFNYCESVDVIVVKLDSARNIAIPADQVIEGILVTLSDNEMECIAVLRRGSYYPWVAEIQPGTCTHLPEDQWDRLDS